MKSPSTTFTSVVGCLALLGVYGLTVAQSARAFQRGDSTFTPSSEGPAITKSGPPVYPAIAVSARVQGTVIVDFRVDVSGRVVDARIVRGIDLLNNAVLEAVRQWQFAPSPAPTGMRVTAAFQLDNGRSLSPRPSRFAQSHPSWVPDNFAFTYRYECRRTSVEIDSIDHLVRNPRGGRTIGFEFHFEGDVVADAFTALDRAKVFELSGRRVQTWKEVSPFQQRGNEVFVTVSADAPIIDVRAVAQVQFFGGSESFSHTLAVRHGYLWKEVSWREPVEKGDDLAKGFSAAGKRIRALVRDSLVPADAAPICL
jgi:TonB family protein